MLIFSVIWILGFVVAYYIIGFLAIAANNKLGYAGAMGVLGCATFVVQILVGLIATKIAYTDFSHLAGICIGMVSVIVIARNMWSLFH